MEASSDQPGQQLNQISTASRGPVHRTRNNTRKNSKHPSGKGKDTKHVVCFCCGRAGHRAKDPLCPATGKTCSACGKQGHFAGVCKSAQKVAKETIPRSATPHRNGLRYVTTEPELSDDEYLFAIGENKEAATVPVTVGSTSIPVIIDSGASVNVLDSATFTKLMDNGFVLRNSSVKLYPYGSETPLPVKGTFSANVSTPQLQTRADFVVVENFNAGSLLGKKTATELGLLRVGPDLPSPVNQITVGSTQAIVDKHDAVLRGVGKLKVIS